MHPLRLALLASSLLVLALPVVTRAQNPCARRVDWGAAGPPDPSSCVATLAGIEAGPTEEEFKAAASCVRRQPRERAALLAQLAEKNACIAETLMHFEDRLRDSPTTEAADAVLSQAYDHYIINMPGRIGQNEGFAALERARAYGRRLLQIQPDLRTLEDWSSPLAPCFGPGPECELRAMGQMINMTRYGRNDVIPSTLFSFEAEATAYHPHNAMWLADLAELVYHDWSCPSTASSAGEPNSWICVEDQLESWGYRGERLQAGSTQAFLATHDDHVVVSFRGTKGWWDIATDLDAWLIRYRGWGKVHRGFAQALDLVWDDLKNELKAVPETRPIFLTGHSLGAALAQLAAHRIERDLGRRVQAVYAFGSPRVGNRAFAKSYGPLGERTFLHVNGLDPVARVPTIPFYQQIRSHLGRFAERNHRFAFVPLEDRPATEPRSLWSTLLAAAEKELESATTYLTRGPRDEIPRFYSPGDSFSTQVGGYHRISQYMFKLACHNTERRYRALGSRQEE